MGRRRLQQKGDLYEQGGQWKLRWREDQIDRDGKLKYGWSKPVNLGPSTGRGGFTEKQARRLAWDNHLSRLDQNMRTPQSIMTLREFVERKFLPEHVAMLKPGGRAHYATLLLIVLDGVPVERQKLAGVKMERDDDGRRHRPEYKGRRLAGLGEVRLRDVTTEDCQKLVSTALTRGYSVQYATHIRNAISAVFTHAESKDWFSGRNPAKRVNLPEMQRRDLHALTFSQVTALMMAVDSFTRALIYTAVLTSMNIAEVMGLKWKRVNLTKEHMTMDGESLMPMGIAVREQWYLKQYGSLKKGSRRRDVPVPPELADALAVLRKRDRHTGPDDPVFVSPESSLPADNVNILKRRILPAAKKLGMPWIGWHDLRRTFATLGDQMGMTTGARQAMMGHADSRMTARYTKTPTENARLVVEKMAKLIGEAVQ